MAGFFGNRLFLAQAQAQAPVAPVPGNPTGVVKTRPDCNEQNDKKGVTIGVFTRVTRVLLVMKRRCVEADV